jgi:hypothetical protein
VARKNKKNKSQLIRDYAQQHAGAKPAAIVAALKAHKVSYALVSNVLHRARHGKGKMRRGQRAGASANGVGLNLEALLAAKQLVERVGGVAVAKAAVAALEKLG